MRSNSDLWLNIIGSISLATAMCIGVYNNKTVSDLRIVIPLVSLATGWMLHQSLDELAKRALQKDQETIYDIIKKTKKKNKAKGKQK